MPRLKKSGRKLVISTPLLSRALKQCGLVRRFLNISEAIFVKSFILAKFLAVGLILLSVSVHSENFP
jgi:hypothetical protein